MIFALAGAGSRNALVDYSLRRASGTVRKPTLSQLQDVVDTRGALG